MKNINNKKMIILKFFGIVRIMSSVKKKALSFSLGFLYLVYNFSVCKLNKGKPKTSTLGPLSSILCSVNSFFRDKRAISFQLEPSYNNINMLFSKIVLFPLAATVKRILVYQAAK